MGILDGSRQAIGRLSYEVQPQKPSIHCRLRAAASKGRPGLPLGQAPPGLHPKPVSRG